MNCSKCSAPLEDHIHKCRYCGTLNSSDLHRVHKHTEYEHDENRHCPRCDEKLLIIDIGVNGSRFLVDQCNSCLGLFFDINELHKLIDSSVSNVFEIDHRRLKAYTDNIQGKEIPKVNYIQCPTCRVFMNRENFGQRSGIIIDKCKEHGVWLDGGELSLIFEWIKAGGKIHNEKVKEERKRLAMLEEQRKLRRARQEALESDRILSTKEATFADFLGSLLT